MDRRGTTMTVKEAESLASRASPVLTLEEAAEFAKVRPEDVLRWTREGLRAMPVGKVGRRGPKRYRIFEAWLVEFMENRAAQVEPKGKGKNAGRPARKASPARGITDPAVTPWW